MNDIIIVEGAQGVGKTTITRLLREYIPYSNLLSLSGNPFKEASGEVKIYRQHFSVLSMIDNCKSCGTNFILDRSFLSEYVYSKLGFKSYDFEASAVLLGNYLHHLADSYNVHFVLLTADECTFKERLNRDKANYIDVPFLPTNSLKQQERYREGMKLLDSKRINKVIIDTVGKEPMDIVNFIMGSSI